jgi:hypothetical protein
MQQKGSEEKAAPQQGPARARKMDTGDHEFWEEALVGRAIAMDGVCAS